MNNVNYLSSVSTKKKKKPSKLLLVTIVFKNNGNLEISMFYLFF